MRNNARTEKHLEEKVALAERHVMTGEKIVARQRQLVDDLRIAHANWIETQKLLDDFENCLRIFRDDLEAYKADLEAFRRRENNGSLAFSLTALAETRGD